MNKKIILGLAGKIACGKETVGRYLMEKYSAEKMRFSDSLRKTLDLFDIPTSRENMQALSTFLRQNYSENVLAKAMVKLTNDSQGEIIIIDGVRRLTDIENFKPLDNFFLIYIDTDADNRYQRYVKRDENPGDAKMDRPEFDRRDNAEAEEQIESLKPQADFIIDNNGSLPELYGQIENILKKIKG